MKETEQTLLDQIKDQVVHQYGYSSWIRFHEESAETGYHLLTSEIMDEIANRYAEDYQRAESAYKEGESSEPKEKAPCQHMYQGPDNDGITRCIWCRDPHEISAPSEPQEKYTCVDCGAEMNEGERKTFTVCETCWDKAYAKFKPVSDPSESQEELWKEVYDIICSLQVDRNGKEWFHHIEHRMKNRFKITRNP